MCSTFLISINNLMKNLLITGLLLFAVLFDSIAQEVRILTLQECIEIAVKNNISVQRSQLNLQTSEVNLQQSVGQRYPNLNLSGNYGFSWGRGIDPTTNQFTTQRIGFNGVGGSSRVGLIQGLQTTNTIRQGRLDVEASEFDVKKAVNDVSLSIALNYLNVIFNKELLENAKFQLESGEQQLDLTKKLVESGALPVSNELQLISQVATNEVNLITAENNLDLALLDLKQALLLPANEQIDISIPDIEIDQAEIESNSIADIYRTALGNQPEIKSADLRVQSANVGLAVSRGGIFPSLSLTGSFQTNYSDLFTEQFITDGTSTIEQFPTDFVTAGTSEAILRNVEVPGGTIEDYGVGEQWADNLSKGLSVSLAVPVFNGFNTRSDIQRSKITAQQAEISSVEQRNILYQSIESAYRNAIAASKTYSASQKQVAALEETFRSLENQYTLGASNFTDYQVASNNLFQAKSDLARAKYDFVFKQKVLEFYQGKPLSF